jgi:hypothetical protein
MKKLIMLVMASSALTAQATETVITPQGNYQITQSANNTTYVTGPRALPPVAVPVTVNPITGVGTVITPQGNYQVIRQGSTTTVIGGARK